MKTPREILLLRHQAVEPKLDRMRTEVLSAELRPKTSLAARMKPTERDLAFGIMQTLWRELIWPCRSVWAGVACAWLLIIGLNMTSPEPSPQFVSKASLRSGEEIRAFIEQRQLLAQLTDALPEPVNTRKPSPLGPRSDRTTRISAV
ncbi:MAG: hypothetical protein ABSC38_01775 [Verrucomicrobiia bacterium]|jgi:hypothetical protein